MPLEILAEESTGEKRKQIEQLYSKRDFRAIGSLPGFSVIASPEDRPEGEDCGRYIFNVQTEPEVTKQLDFVIEHYDKTEMAEPGDIVVYFDREGNNLHVARSIGHGRVVSKFGKYSPVFEHNEDDVPSSYGSVVVHYRDPAVKKGIA